MKNPFSRFTRARDKPRNAVSEALTFFMGGSLAGKRMNERSALQLTTVYACVRVIAETMGFATALSSVGIETEAGGSAFSKVMIQMQLAVETGKNGLDDFAKVAGMSSKEFQRAFQTDAAGAIQAFIEGLGRMDERGVSAIKVLDDMGIKEVRMRNALLLAANTTDEFARAQDMANQAWEENVALQNEAAERYGTTESQLIMLANAAKNLAILFCSFHRVQQ